MGAQVGCLAVGKFADIVAMESNPLMNFSALRSLDFVMKQGHVHRNDRDQAMQADPLRAVDPTDPAFQADDGSKQTSTTL
jgi:hypothetical protein